MLSRELWQSKRLIAGVTVFTTMSAIILSLVLPKTYSAEASILPLRGGDSSALLAAGIASQLGAMGGMLGGIPGDKSADLVEILSSRTMANRLIERYSLDKEFSGWKHRSELTTKLRKITTISAPTLKNNTLTIRVEAPKAGLAAQIANAYVAELKDMLDEIGYNSASKNRKFVEEQLNKNKIELSQAEEALTRFQAKNQITSLPETVVASIRTLSELEAQRISAAVQAESTSEALNEAKSRISTLQVNPSTVTELEIKRKSLAAQENAFSNAKKLYFDQLVSLPPKAMALARLQRDVQVQNAIYLALTQQYQTALINESKDSDLFLSLDQAEAPIKPTKPRLMINSVLGALIGFAGAIMLTVIQTSLRRRKHTSQQI